MRNDAYAGYLLVQLVEKRQSTLGLGELMATDSAFLSWKCDERLAVWHGSEETLRVLH